jgi:hypothetical protein
MCSCPSALGSYGSDLNNSAKSLNYSSSSPLSSASQIHTKNVASAVFTDSEQSNAVIDDHNLSKTPDTLKNTITSFQDNVNKPTHEEYQLDLSFVPVVSTNYNRNPGAWAMKEREILERQLSVTSRPFPKAKGLWPTWVYWSRCRCCQ